MARQPRRQLTRRAILIASFLLFPVTLNYFSPVLVIMGAATGVLTGSALVFLAQFVSALFLGRAFCGWVCPAAGQQEACFVVQSRKVNGRRCDWIKYAFWVPWLGTILVLLSRHGIRATEFLFMMDSPVSVDTPARYPVYLTVTGLIFILSLSVGRRAFCHCGCWMAPFMVLGDRLQRALGIPALHLRAVPERCVQCGACTSGCPMSLDVAAMVGRGRLDHSECVLCGHCVDACRQGAISYAVGLTRTPAWPRAGQAAGGGATAAGQAGRKETA